MGRSTRWRTVRVVILGSMLVAALLVGAQPAAHWWHDRSYLGHSRRATLEWDCDGIIWRDDARGATWHAVASSGPLDTTPAVKVEYHYHHVADGVLHFDSYRNATFRSDAGGRVRLQRLDKFFTHGCEGVP
jgi:hypothetical protein